jgi:hypothetical protein
MTWNGHKIPAYITGAVAVLGAAGGLIWWTAHQEGRIAATEVSIARVEQAQKSMDTPLGARVAVLSERVTLFNEQLTTNKELAEKIVRQQEENTRILNEIKSSIKKP